MTPLPLAERPHATVERRSSADILREVIDARAAALAEFLAATDAVLALGGWAAIARLAEARAGFRAAAAAVDAALAPDPQQEPAP